eukprot:1947107-Karenia_brevis.AAC.1
MHGLGLDQDTCEAMCEFACCDLWAEGGASSHLRDLVADLHCFTWISVEGVDVVSHVAGGALAGTAL